LTVTLTNAKRAIKKTLQRIEKKTLKGFGNMTENAERTKNGCLQQMKHLAHGEKKTSEGRLPILLLLGQCETAFLNAFRASDAAMKNQ
jgi:hypothetical protein